MDDRPGLPSVAAGRQHQAYMHLIARHRSSLRTAMALVAILTGAIVVLLLGIALGWIHV